MRFELNGYEVPAADGLTVADMVAIVSEHGTKADLTKPVSEYELEGDDELFGYAVAINAAVVSRSAWEKTVINAGDRVEILAPVQGG